MLVPFSAGPLTGFWKPGQVVMLPDACIDQAAVTGRFAGRQSVLSLKGSQNLTEPGCCDAALLGDDPHAIDGCCMSECVRMGSAAECNGAYRFTADTVYLCQWDYKRHNCRQAKDEGIKCSMSAPALPRHIAPLPASPPPSPSPPPPPSVSLPPPSTPSRTERKLHESSTAEPPPEDDVGFIHVGKTGGSTVKEWLEGTGVNFTQFHTNGAPTLEDIRQRERWVISVRDPIERCGAACSPSPRPPPRPRRRPNEPQLTHTPQFHAMRAPCLSDSSDARPTRDYLIPLSAGRTG